MKFVVFCLIVFTCFSLILSRHSRISSGLKLIASFMLVIFALGSYDTMRSVSGYPAVDKLPEEVEIVWGRVVEGEQKYIELWVLFERRPGEKLLTLHHEENPISRIYRIEYTKKRHELLLKILEDIKKGKERGLKGDINKRGEDSFEDSTQLYRLNSSRKIIRKNAGRMQ